MIPRYLIGTCALVSLALVNVPAAAKYRLHYHDGLRAACAKEINSQCRGVTDALASCSHVCINIRLVYRQSARGLFGDQ